MYALNRDPAQVSVPRPSELDLELQPSIAAGRRARYSAKIVNRSSQASRRSCPSAPTATGCAR